MVAVVYTLVVLLHIKFAQSDSCSAVSKPEVLPENVGKILDNQAFLTVEANKPVVCAVRCMRQKKCKSINYDHTGKKCALNIKSSTTAQSDMATVSGTNLIEYFSVDEWPQEFLGACKYHNCPDEKICQTSSGSSHYTCSTTYSGDVISSAITTGCVLNTSCADCTPTREYDDFKYGAKGCYDSKQNVLPIYIENLRPTINWTDIATFQSIIDTCSKKARENHYDFFGIEYYGECWAGNSSEASFQGSGQIGVSDCNTKCLYLDLGVGSSNVMFVYQWV